MTLNILYILLSLCFWCLITKHVSLYKLRKRVDSLESVAEIDRSRISQLISISYANVNDAIEMSRAHGQIASLKHQQELMDAYNKPAFDFGTPAERDFIEERLKELERVIKKRLDEDAKKANQENRNG